MYTWYISIIIQISNSGYYVLPRALHFDCAYLRLYFCTDVQLPMGK